MSYDWTDDEDAVVMDAVAVSITSKSRILEIGGLEFGDPIARIYWPARGTSEGELDEHTEGPFDDVRSALEFAEKQARLHGFRRVVIVLQDRAFWSDSWGLLAPTPGLD